MGITYGNKQVLYLVVTLKSCGQIKFSFVYNKMVLTLKMMLIHLILNSESHLQQELRVHIQTYFVQFTLSVEK
jgi:hypothetical protein